MPRRTFRRCCQDRMVQIDVTVLTETGDYSSWFEFVIRSEPLLRKFCGELIAAQNVDSFFHGNENGDGTEDPISARPGEVRPYRTLRSALVVKGRP